MLYFPNRGKSFIEEKQKKKTLIPQSVQLIRIIMGITWLFGEVCQITL